MKPNVWMAVLATATALVLPVAAQIPNTLLHSIPAPISVQDGTQMGYSVAVDGGYTVIGTPYDDAGVVKVFDTATGELLFLLPNPSPAANDAFGFSVAISGTRVVVGAFGDDIGATDSGGAYVFDLSSGTPTTPIASLSSPVPEGGANFGNSVSISGSLVVVGAYDYDGGALNAGSVFVFDLNSGTPTTPIVTLAKTSPVAADKFGVSVAISGPLVMVGAYLDDTGATNAGSAYLFDLNGTTPSVPVITFNNPTPEASDLFGCSIAISGMRVIIGAEQDNTGASNAGSAYAYDLSSGTPTVPAFVLNNPAPSASENFGSAVSASGTYVIVGAYNDDSGGTNSGNAYVYDLSSGTPTVPLSMNNPAPAAGDLFGWSVAISAMHVVAGAPHDDTEGTNAGSAYLYDLSSGTPTVPTITINNTPGPSLKDNFGTSVAISGARMVVGAFRDDSGAANAGSAYVFDLSGGTPTIPAFALNNPSPAGNDGFGVSVAMSGDKVVVGAASDDLGAADAGTTYVFNLSSGTPTVPIAILSSPAPEQGANFGYSVAVSDPIVVVGAYDFDGGALNAGIAYVFDLNSGTPTVPILTLNNPSPAVADKFGISVAISGTRIVVGAFLEDTGASAAGSAYVFDLSSGTPTVPVAALHNPDPAANDYFGKSVAISGARVVVGAYLDDTGATDAGSAYVYDLESGTPTVPIATLNNPNPVASDNFGYSVAIFDERVVVGAYNDDTGATDSGRVYVYDLSSGTPTVPLVVLDNPSPGVTEQFGTSVATNGTNIAVGSPNDDTVGIDKGYAYVFGTLPEIALEVLPSNANIIDGGNHDFGITVVGGTISTTFVIKNTGFADLLLTGTPKVMLSGADAGIFSVIAQPGSPVSGPTGTTTFTVQMLPTSGGVKTAALNIPNNDTDEAPFDISITGTALSFTDDTDVDGLNDASEFQMAALGFDWQVSQPSLVNTYTSTANGAGYFTPAQVQALNVGTPLIQRNPTTGEFTLIIGVEKSTTLQPGSFLPFPMTAPQTLINGQGKLEFRFTVPDNAAFFQLRAE